MNILRFYGLIEKTCKNFVGIFYRCDDVELAYDLYKTNCHVIMCANTILLSLMTLGFDAFCMISLNTYPECIRGIYDFMINSKLREAYDANTKYYTYIKEISTTKIGCFDWVEVFKGKFNEAVDFNVGGLRKPHYVVPFENY